MVLTRKPVESFIGNGVINVKFFAMTGSTSQTAESTLPGENVGIFFNI